jgi:hypothetical protein
LQNLVLENDTLEICVLSSEDRRQKAAKLAKSNLDLVVGSAFYINSPFSLGNS